MGEAERWVPVRKKGAVHHLGGERLKNDSIEDRSHELCLVYGPHHFVNYQTLFAQPRHLLAPGRHPARTW